MSQGTAHSQGWTLEDTTAPENEPSLCELPTGMCPFAVLQCPRALPTPNPLCPQIPPVPQLLLEGWEGPGVLWPGIRAGFPGDVPTGHSQDTLCHRERSQGQHPAGGRYLQDGVGLQQPVLDGLDLLAGGAGDSVVLQDLLGGLGLAGAALPRDEDALVPPLGAQRAVRVVRDGVAGRGQPGSAGLPRNPG